MSKYILWFKEISSKDVPLVGGKNASLGEMISQLTKKGIHPVKSRKAGIPPKAELFNGVNIPDGFALTTKAYWYYLKENKVDKKLKEIFKKFDPKSLKNLQKIGKSARNLILRAKFPEDLKQEIITAYQKLSQEYNQKDVDVAVRSSGVAEDQPTMSFAGEFESYLNIKGKEDLLNAIKKCIASTFSDRAIAYREEKKVPHLKFALSVGVQKMVRSDLASSGVIFTIDTESGFPNIVLINSIYGVGEMIVKGKITPDEFYVFKPTLRQGFKSIILKNLGRKDKKYVYSKTGGLREVTVLAGQQLKFSLTDEEILILAKWSGLIEKHYKIPQDIEWAKDGKTGELFVVQSRPETVHAPKDTKFYEEYKIKTSKKPILTGTAIGDKIGQGKVRIIPNISQISKFQKGEVLVTKMTDPDWVAAFPLASAIVTEEGGRTCHAAIVSRELGIPAVVGVKGAAKILKNGQIITVDCVSGGKIFEGKIPFETKRYDLKEIPKLKTKIMMKMGRERRLQIGKAQRAEKIRTYNFPQDRVTDHRIKKSWHNIEGIMAGKLEPIISALQKSNI